MTTAVSNPASDAPHAWSQAKSTKCSFLQPSRWGEERGGAVARHALNVLRVAVEGGGDLLGGVPPVQSSLVGHERRLCPVSGKGVECS